MARAGRKRKKVKLELDALRPTPEREGKNHFQSAGMARKLVPEIDRLHAKGWLTDAEHQALWHYRDQAGLADKSPVRSCINFEPRGGYGPGVAILSASIETGRIERDMGELWRIARAVAVDDKSLTQWCVEQHGGRERTHEGKVIAIVPPDKTVAIARMHLRMAAHRIVK